MGLVRAEYPEKADLRVSQDEKVCLAPYCSQRHDKKSSMPSILVLEPIVDAAKSLAHEKSAFTHDRWRCAPHSGHLFRGELRAALKYNGVCQ